MTENENASRSGFFLLATRPGFDQNSFASHELPMCAYLQKSEGG
jgi:hypothetical protein